MTDQLDLFAEPELADDDYADTHTSAAAAGPVRRVTWATLRRRAADPILF